MSILKFVDSKIFYAITALLVISTGTVFAQESLITVQTDDNHYDEGDTIVISGQVTTIVGSTPATLQLFSEGNLVDIAQITIAQKLFTYSNCRRSIMEKPRRLYCQSIIRRRKYC
jgi:hypothetical protein